MEKKSFRPKKPASPTYPVLREVDHDAMTSWGLATLGGLLLGGVACTPAHADQPPPGEPPAVRVEKKPDGKAVRSPDAGAPEATTVLHVGKPKSSPAPEPHRDGGAPPSLPPRRTAGVPMPQRIDPPAKDTGKTDTPKKDSSAKSSKGDKKPPHDSAKKDTTPAPNRPKTERTP